jgi:hypothetical protein
MVAAKLARKSHQVDLIEKEAGILEGASKHNHNRIHLGYHYLRSIATAQESREGIPTFMGIFGSAFLMGFPNYYCMAAEGSKSTPEHFEAFCDKVDIGCIHETPPAHLLDARKVSGCYRVPEPVFDYFELKNIVANQIAHPGISLFPNTEVRTVKTRSEKYLVGTDAGQKEYDLIINATYKSINKINEMLGVPSRTYLYEDVVIPIFRYEHPAFGLTIMDGGFCSIEPYGFRKNEFLLYHVNYSVVGKHLGNRELRPVDDFDIDRIYEESRAFLPFLKDVERLGYYRTIRIVMERDDDARLSMIYHDAPNYWSILSGKVTTCIDVANKLVASIQGQD